MKEVQQKIVLFIKTENYCYYDHVRSYAYNGRRLNLWLGIVCMFKFHRQPISLQYSITLLNTTLFNKVPTCKYTYPQELT